MDGAISVVEVALVVIAFRVEALVLSVIYVELSLVDMTLGKK